MVDALILFSIASAIFRLRIAQIIHVSVHERIVAHDPRVTLHVLWQKEAV